MFISGCQQLSIVGKGKIPSRLGFLRIHLGEKALLTPQIPPIFASKTKRIDNKKFEIKKNYCFTL